MSPIPINLAVEDNLSEAVLRKILKVSGRQFKIGAVYNRGGFGYLKNTIHGFNNAAKNIPFLVLTDLDQIECAPFLIRDWLPEQKHPNLVFRVAVRETEAWLLAHREQFSDYFRININMIPSDVENIFDPKQVLMNIVRKSKNRELKEDIIPPAKSIRSHGPNYNGRLIEYVQNYWDPIIAQKNSLSLKKTITLLKVFTPTW
ncbi:MAG: hypothetical protein HYZ34_09060 [Ignavibacteriae bacterium]|nr:hypothetical protein [Ignavibacteriota bacterium]